VIFIFRFLKIIALRYLAGYTHGTEVF